MLTRDELRDEAKALGILGISSMTKAQLEAALVTFKEADESEAAFAAAGRAAFGIFEPALHLRAGIHRYRTLTACDRGVPTHEVTDDLTAVTCAACNEEMSA